MPAAAHEPLMRRRFRPIAGPAGPAILPAAVVAAMALFMAAAPAAARDQDGASPPPSPQASQTDDASRVNPSDAGIIVRAVEVDPPADADSAGRASSSDPLDWLFDDIRALLEEVDNLRVRLAQAELRAAEAEREAAELRQFIEDHDEYGDAWEEYQAIREIRRQEVRRKMLEERRERYEEERAERRARYEAAQARRQQRDAEQARLQQYEKAGFAPLGLNVFGGRMAYYYGTKEDSDMRVEYDSLVGLYYRPGVNQKEIDYSRMTISGSVLNAAEEVRNVGVAITFFDEYGNQVGSEIIQINNARPNVPYPFTSTIEMALNRPFETSSTYVLYADPIAAAAAAAPEVGPINGK